MTDIVERLHPGVFSVPTHLAHAMAEGADEIKRLRAECQRLAAEVSRAHKDALTWMERAAAANAEIERLREALENIAGMSREMEHTLYGATRVAAVALAAKEPGHE